MSVGAVLGRNIVAFDQLANISRSRKKKKGKDPFKLRDS